MSHPVAAANTLLCDCRFDNTEDTQLCLNYLRNIYFLEFLERFEFQEKGFLQTGSS